MNYGKIQKFDIANGPGIRFTIFVSGCTKYCKGCFNPETWDFNFGEEFSDRVLEKFLDEFDMNKENLDGITLLGGDPLELANLSTVKGICQCFKDMFPDKTIWIYTGAYWEDLYTYIQTSKNQNLIDILSLADVLVDGRFVEEKKDLRLKFRGSSNQRIIDLQKTKEYLHEHKIYDDEYHIKLVPVLAKEYYEDMPETSL